MSGFSDWLKPSRKREGSKTVFHAVSNKVVVQPVKRKVNKIREKVNGVWLVGKGRDLYWKTKVGGGRCACGGMFVHPKCFVDIPEDDE